MTRLLRLRYASLVSAALLPLDVLVAYTRARVPGSIPGEYALFGPAGAALLRGNFAAVLSVPDTQAGPFELVPYGVAKLLHVHGVVGWTAFYVVVIFLVCLAFFSVALLPLETLRGRLVLYGSAVAGVIAVLGSVIPGAVFLGHPAEVLIPALWVAAGWYARRNNALVGATLVALSTGFEVWGLLGAPVILLAARPRFVRSALVGAVIVVVLYLPLAAAGHFAMFRFHWSVSATSIYGILDAGLVDFPWTLRLLQAVLALGAGVAVALLARRSPHAIWVTPFAVIAARLLVDPLLLSYYWLVPATVALLAMVSAIASRSWAAAALAVVALAATFAAPSLPLVTAAGFVVLAGVAVVLARRTPSVGFRK